MPIVIPELPAYATRVLSALEDAGYEAWVVGGWVRDALRGCDSHDVDVCSSAPWQEAAAVLEGAGIDVHPTGTAHGTITAVIDHKPVEVTTYRVESTYSDLRHPDKVQFVDDVRLDLARRDLTVNAMAFHPQRGLLDLFGGYEDLSDHVIRTVGDPHKRFGEDALRVLRAVRFACRLGYWVEDTTAAALVDCAPELDRIAPERVGQEMDGIVATGQLTRAMREHREVIFAAIPETAPMLGFDQRSPYHCFDVWEHTVRVVEGVATYTGGLASNRLTWAALLHDIGKPRSYTVGSNGQGHFYGHPASGADMSDRIMRRLALPLDEVRAVVALVRFHDRPVKASRHSVSRMLYDIERACPGELPALGHELLTLKRADASAKAPAYRRYANDLDKVERVLRRLFEEDAPYNVRGLAIKGADVMAACHMRPNPAVGLALDDCLREVMHGRVANTREALIDWLEHSQYSRA